MTQSRRPARTRLLLRGLVLVGVFALGGTAGVEAATQITSKHVRDDALLSRDFRNGSVTGAAFRDSTVTATAIAGDVTGPPGDQGPPGERGAPGIRAVTKRLSAPRTGPPVVNLTAGCRGDEFPLGAGAAPVSPPGTRAQIFKLFPADNSGGFAWSVLVGGPDPFTYSAWVLCAKIR